MGDLHGQSHEEYIALILHLSIMMLYDIAQSRKF